MQIVKRSAKLSLSWISWSHLSACSCEYQNVWNESGCYQLRSSERRTSWPCTTYLPRPLSFARYKDFLMWEDWGHTRDWKDPSDAFVELLLRLDSFLTCVCILHVQSPIHHAILWHSHESLHRQRDLAKCIAWCTPRNTQAWTKSLLWLRASFLSEWGSASLIEQIAFCYVFAMPKKPPTLSRTWVYRETTISSSKNPMINHDIYQARSTTQSEIVSWRQSCQEAGLCWPSWVKIVYCVGLGWRARFKVDSIANHFPNNERVPS